MISDLNQQIEEKAKRKQRQCREQNKTKHNPLINLLREISKDTASIKNNNNKKKQANKQQITT